MTGVPRIAIEESAVNDMMVMLDAVVPNGAELRLVFQLLFEEDAAPQPAAPPRAAAPRATLPAGSLLR